MEILKVQPVDKSLMARSSSSPVSLQRKSNYSPRTVDSGDWFNLLAPYPMTKASSFLSKTNANTIFAAPRLGSPRSMKKESSTKKERQLVSALKKKSNLISNYGTPNRKSPKSPVRFKESSEFSSSSSSSYASTKLNIQTRKSSNGKSEPVTSMPFPRSISSPLINLRV